MMEIENAVAVRVVSVDGTDITDQCVLSGVIPDLELTAVPEVALTVARIELKSARSGMWPSVNVGPSDQVFLWKGGPLRIDARVKMVS